MVETLTAGMIHRLAEIDRLMGLRNDELHQGRIRDLIRKWDQEEFTVAFCGHFSAGKSTLLNELYGKELLPTSPVPTSANVVKVRAGEDRVVMTLTSGERHEYRGAYTDADLQRLCQNGEEVTAVEVYRQDAPLPEGVTLLDTPGVDSTDDAHRRSTEAALHLADAIFYVMDYNHVQSEGNLHFVRRLKERNKQVYLVINQIDKHREEELSFDRFRERVEETFSGWEPAVDGVFYTSLRQPDHPHNALNDLKQQIRELVLNRSELLEQSLDREASHLVREHLRVLEERKRSIAEEYAAEAEPRSELEREYHFWQQERTRLDQAWEQTDAEFRKGLEDILANAYLMPYENRERARLYLETILTKFRVGWLFSRGKTEKEKESRYRSFLNAVQQTVDAQLDVHIKQYGVRFLNEKGIYSEERVAGIYKWESPVHGGLLKETVKEGAGLSGDYVLKYTADLSEKIKQKYRRLAMDWFASIADALRQQIAVQQKEAEMELTRLQERIDSAKKIERLESDYREAESVLNALLDGRMVPEEEVDLKRILGEMSPVIKEGNWPEAMDPSLQESQKADTEDPISSDAPSTPVEANRTEAALVTFRQAESVMEGIKPLQSIRQDLAAKRERVENRHFTVALFGAFSAGKSSFANALMGDRVLPVSPNPTTAAINRISAPEGENRHKEVIIRFKEKETLLQEVQQACQRYGKTVDSLEDSLEVISEMLERSDPDPGKQTVLSFLRAFREGYEEVVGMLGQSRRFTLEAFSRYVSDESRACFVELAELYYDCPLTRQGVTLVDTPGADSIHARHTEVAFRYIKDADAILFVTYYNHAFSRADREFLIQLGRVKDAFEMDKMFFIMNAADLASSDRERRDVMAYLEDQLLQYGIRKPRMHAVSSLQALKPQAVDGDLPPSGTGMGRFREAFSTFLNVDLMSVSLHSMESDLNRARGVLRGLLQDAKEDNKDRRRKQEAYREEQAALSHLLEGMERPSDQHALRQEIEEQLYYVKQRLLLRYHDVFAEIFNPAVLSGNQGSKKQLNACVREMIEFIRSDLLQELRATSLRVERWMAGGLSQLMDTFLEEAHQLNSNLPLSRDPQWEVSAPDWNPPFPELGPEAFKQAVSLFKNSRDFFEKGGKTRVRDVMKTGLEEAVADYLRQEMPRWVNHYEGEWRNAVEDIRRKWTTDATGYYEDLSHVLSQEVDPSDYEQAVEKLNDLLRELDRKQT